MISLFLSLVRRRSRPPSEIGSRPPPSDRFPISDFDFPEGCHLTETAEQLAARRAATAEVASNDFARQATAAKAERKKQQLGGGADGDHGGGGGDGDTGSELTTTADGGDAAATPGAAADDDDAADDSPQKRLRATIAAAAFEMKRDATSEGESRFLFSVFLAPVPSRKAPCRRVRVPRRSSGVDTRCHNADGRRNGRAAYC